MLLETSRSIGLIGASQRAIQTIRVGNEEDAEEDEAAVGERCMSVKSFDTSDAGRLCAQQCCWRMQSAIGSGAVFFFSARADARHGGAGERILVGVGIDGIRHGEYPHQKNID